MAESTRFELFQKSDYTEAHKEKNGKDVQLELSREWQEMKKLKDSDLKVSVDNKISELKNSVRRIGLYCGNMERICQWKNEEETFRW